jgi:lysophospholipase L1-like esterase
VPAAALVACLSLVGCLAEPEATSGRSEDGLVENAVATEADGPALAAAIPVMIVGDSITQGSAGDFTWRYRLWRHLQSVAPGAVDFVGDRTHLFDNVSGVQGSHAHADGDFDRDHHALWGRAILQEKDTIHSAVAQYRPRVLCILMGINDLAYQTNPQQTFENLKQLIANARAARPDLQIVVGMVLTRYNFWDDVFEHVEAVNQFNGLVATLPQLSTDISPIRVARTDVGWDPRLHTWDGTHANGTGEVRIAAAFADALATLNIGAAFGGRWQVQWPGRSGTMTAYSTATAPGRVLEPPYAIGRDRAASLSWGRAPNATAYLIRQLRSGGTEEHLPWPVPNTSFEPGYLWGGHRYQFYVVPINDGGKNRLSWNAVPGATGYVIQQRDATANGSWQALPYPLTALTFDDTPLHADHVYEYAIVPHKGLMAGVWSPTAQSVMRRVGPASSWSNVAFVKTNVGRRQRAADFARYWGDPSRDDAWRGRWGYLGQDCTHFVSEALLHAGWGELGSPDEADSGTFSTDFTDLYRWWRVREGEPIVAGVVYPFYTLFSQRNASMSFTVAHELWRHLHWRRATGSVEAVDDPRMLDYGDVITFAGEDGTVGHAVIVTGSDDEGWPLYSQHTNSKSNASLRDLVNRGGGAGAEYWHLLGLDGL